MDKQGLDKGQASLGLENDCSSERPGIPRLNQCYLCKAWKLEKTLSPIEVPDQAGYIRKLVCKTCLKEIQEEEKVGR
jgi:hypothetical protein